MDVGRRQCSKQQGRESKREIPKTLSENPPSPSLQCLLSLPPILAPPSAPSIPTRVSKRESRIKARCTQNPPLHNWAMGRAYLSSIGVRAPSIHQGQIHFLPFTLNRARSFPSITSAALEFGKRIIIFCLYPLCSFPRFTHSHRWLFNFFHKF